MHGKKRLVISLILTFLLSLVIFGIGQMIGLSLGLWNKERFRDTVASSEYYRTVAGNLETMTQGVLEDYNLPIELAKDLWKQAEIRKDVDDYVLSIITDGQTISIADKIKERLEGRLDEYRIAEDVRMEEAEWKRTKDEASSIIAYHYKSGIELPLIREYINYCEKMNQHIRLYLVVGISVSLFIILLLIFLYRRKYKAVRYVAYAVLSASIMGLLVNGLVRFNWIPDGRFIDNVNYQELCSQILNQGLSYVNLIGGMGIVLGIILFFLVVLMRKNSRYS